MRRRLGLLLACLAVTVGCASKDEGKPNPDLKTPDIPPGRGAEGKGGGVPKK